MNTERNREREKETRERVSEGKRKAASEGERSERESGAIPPPADRLLPTPGTPLLPLRRPSLSFPPNTNLTNGKRSVE